MKNVRKVVVSSLALGMLVPFSVTVNGCAIERVFSCMGKESLTVYNWGEYIDLGLVAQFEADNGICVDYVTFDSNETAITRMKNEVFDVIVPSDYAIEQLAQEKLILELDWSKIELDPTTDLADGLVDILDSLKNQGDGFDFLKYAVPYFWGNVGIVYNSTVAGIEEDLETQGWEIVRNPDYSVLYYDSSRDGFMVPLKQLGYSVNTTNDTEIAAAEAWLKGQRETLGANKLRYVGDDVLSLMPTGNYDIGLVYSGDAIYIMDQNEDYDFYTPTTGTNVWADGMVIHKDSQKVDLAYKFINFMSTFDAAYANTLWAGYNASVKEAFNEALAEDYTDYAYIMDYQVQPNDEVYRYNEDSKAKIDEAWIRVKS